jgi:Arabinose-binding domain of AraC transcription regulator, N-term
MRSAGGVPRELAARIEELAASPRRIRVSQLQELVTELVAATNDPDLGLRAALHTELGDFEVLE